jgi:uncharacterized cupin superfamily protein
MKPLIRRSSESDKKSVASWPVWEKEPSTFPYTYDKEEKCLILQGKATVSCSEGDFWFAAGDFVVFPKGLKCTWKIAEKIKKKYTFG